MLFRAVGGIFQCNLRLGGGGVTNPTLEFGSMCAKVSSISSKPIERNRRIFHSLNIKALATQPKRCARTNSSSTVSMMFANLLLVFSGVKTRQSFP